MYWIPIIVSKLYLFLLSFCLLTTRAGWTADRGKDLTSTLGIPFVKVYDPSRNEPTDWQVEDVKNEILIWSHQGIATVEAIQSDQSWSSLHKTVSINLNIHPLLQIRVLSATKRWYLILSSPKMQNDYVRLIETDKKGLFTFDIPQLTQLSGHQKFDIKIGVSNPEAFTLSNERMSFNQLVFIERQPKTDSIRASKSSRKKIKKFKKNNKEITLFIPDGTGVDLWKESFKNGPQEVRYSVKDGRGIIQGRMKSRNWGALSRNVAVDLERFPIIEIRVLSSSKKWYLLISNPKLKNGFERLIESEKSGSFQFHIPALTKLSGLQTLEIKLGVSHPGNSSIRGEWIVFDQLRFRKL